MLCETRAPDAPSAIGSDRLKAAIIRCNLKFFFRPADYAVSLAKHYDGEVHFVHVVPEVRANGRAVENSVPGRLLR